MRIAVVGTGYVGMVTGTCFADTGNDVTCVDIDQDKIDKLNGGEVPIYEPGLKELIERNVRFERLCFSTELHPAYQRAEVIFICVGTPSDQAGHSDLRHVLSAGRDIGEAIESAPGPTGGSIEDRRAKIIVVKSTVPVGTNAEVGREIAALTNKPFQMASNPEFLKEGAAVGDFMKPDRVVIGTEDKGTAQRLRDLYEPFVRQGNPIFVMDIASAEMVKYASNAMLATKISFINEIANLCEAYGADVEEVRRGMCADQRIGNQFLYPGLGYGGSCFPKDVLACISMGSRSSTPTALLAAVDEVNRRQRDAFVRKIEQHFSDGPSEGSSGGGPGAAPDLLAGRRLVIWGVAFKPGTDDIREAPSITLIEALLARGATVVTYDPVAKAACRKVLGDRIEYADNQMDSVNGADGLLICTEWGEFKFPDFDELKARLRSPVIFDGRNLYRRRLMYEHGFTYYCVGRRPVVPEGQKM